MRCFLTLIAACFILGPAASAAGPVPEEVVGIHALDYMHTLPLMRDLIICREASAHDKKGGNDNGFTNKAEFVRREFGPRVVILDTVGPGCLMSFWYSWPNTPGYQTWVEPLWKLMLGKARFFFDGEEKPRVAVPLRKLVGTSPHVYPLAVGGEQSTGGYITYVPLPFQDGLKVVVDGGGIPDFFYHLWYHSYPWGTKVDTWTGTEDLSKFLELWSPEVAEKPAGSKTMELNGLRIGPGGSKTIVELKGPGAIMCLRMNLPEDDRLLRAAWLKSWWDDDPNPSISAPLSLFFAVENRFSKKQYKKKQNAEFRSLVLGRDSEGLWFFRLPMPFSRKARLAIENRGADPVAIGKVKVEYEPSAVSGLGRTAGYLGTQFRESDDLPPARDYLLAELKGRGHIVGTVLAVEDTPINFLEGDERIYFDGSRSPLVMGDATETYFNGSWYFWGRAFVCPLHGAPAFHLHEKGVDATMFRFHLTDFAPYRSSARFSIQHGAFNNVYGKYRSLVFYYGLPKPSLKKTDYLKPADPEERERHGYFGAQPLRVRERSGFFEGERNGQDLGLKKKPEWMDESVWMLLLTVRGVFHRPPRDSADRVSFKVAEHDKPYGFKVKADPGARAVMLRRVLDQSAFDQKARIEVEGCLAGVWLNAGNNKWKIFAEDDLILNPECTRGKSELAIKIIPESKTFTAAEYTVFSIMLPE